LANSIFSWRSCCRKCVQERNRRDGFTGHCDDFQPETALEAGDYSINDPRTRRALNERLDVGFAKLGPLYEVNFEQRQPDNGCKHLRRVDLEIQTGLVPAPDGTFSH